MGGLQRARAVHGQDDAVEHTAPRTSGYAATAPGAALARLTHRLTRGGAYARAAVTTMLADDADALQNRNNECKRARMSTPTVPAQESSRCCRTQAPESTKRITEQQELKRPQDQNLSFQNYGEAVLTNLQKKQDFGGKKNNHYEMKHDEKEESSVISMPKTLITIITSKLTSKKTVQVCEV